MHWQQYKINQISVTMYKNLVLFLLAVAATSFSFKHKAQPVPQPSQSLNNPQFFKLQIKDGFLSIPAKYNGLSFPTTIVSSKQIPSWIFVGNQGQLCNQQSEKLKCSKVSSKITCQTGCQKYNQDKVITNAIVDITSSQRLKMSYQVNGTLISGNFLQPKKVTYKSSFLVNKKIYGMVNSADWQSAFIKADAKSFYAMVTSNTEQAMLTNQKAIIISKESIQIDDKNKQLAGDQVSKNQNNAAVQGSQKDQEVKLKQPNLQKQSSKQQQTNKDQNKDKFFIIANEQDSAKKNFEVSSIQLNLQDPQNPALFTVPIQVGRFLRKIVIKKHLNGDCDLKDNIITCKRKKQTLNIPIDLCINQNTCIRINAESLVKASSKKKFELLFSDNPSSIDDKTIILKPAFLKMYSVLIKNGKVTQLVKNQKYQLASLDSNDDGQVLNVQDDSEKYAVNTQAKNDTSKRNYITTIIISIFIYGIIAVVLLLLIKMKATQSFVAKTLDYAFGTVAGYFHRKKGYQAPNLAEQIDDSGTMNVGYQKNDAKGKQMFWEKNSVEGI